MGRGACRPMHQFKSQKGIRQICDDDEEEDEDEDDDVDDVDDDAMMMMTTTTTMMMTTHYYHIIEMHQNYRIRKPGRGGGSPSAPPVPITKIPSMQG